MIIYVVLKLNYSDFNLILNFFVIFINNNGNFFKAEPEDPSDAEFDEPFTMVVFTADRSFKFAIKSEQDVVFIRQYFEPETFSGSSTPV